MCENNFKFLVSLQQLCIRKQSGGETSYKGEKKTNVSMFVPQSFGLICPFYSSD